MILCHREHKHIIYFINNVVEKDKAKIVLKITKKYLNKFIDCGDYDNIKYLCDYIKELKFDDLSVSL